MCLVTYPFGGNGPWNYMFERPPEGVKFVHHVGVYFGEDDRGNHLVAATWMTLADGSVQPTHVQTFSKDTQLEFL